MTLSFLSTRRLATPTSADSMTHPPAHPGLDFKALTEDNCNAFIGPRAKARVVVQRDRSAGLWHARALRIDKGKQSELFFETASTPARALELLFEKSAEEVHQYQQANQTLAYPPSISSRRDVESDDEDEDEDEDDDDEEDEDDNGSDIIVLSDTSSYESDSDALSACSSSSGRKGKPHTTKTSTKRRVADEAVKARRSRSISPVQKRVNSNGDRSSNVSVGDWKSEGDNVAAARRPPPPHLRGVPVPMAMPPPMPMAMPLPTGFNIPAATAAASVAGATGPHISGAGVGPGVGAGPAAARRAPPPWWGPRVPVAVPGPAPATRMGHRRPRFPAPVNTSTNSNANANATAIRPPNGRTGVKIFDVGPPKQHMRLKLLRTGCQSVNVAVQCSASLQALQRVAAREATRPGRFRQVIPIRPKGMPAVPSVALPAPVMMSPRATVLRVHIGGEVYEVGSEFGDDLSPLLRCTADDLEVPKIELELIETAPPMRMMPTAAGLSDEDNSGGLSVV